MLDYDYITADGKRVPIAELPTRLIHELLAGPINIVDSDKTRDPVTDVRKRLDLELFIRSKGLRS